MSDTSKSDVPSETVRCDRCDGPMHPGAVADDYDEMVCRDCDQKQSEAAWERHCEDYHDGGSTRFRFTEQPIRKGGTEMTRSSIEMTIADRAFEWERRNLTALGFEDWEIPLRAFGAFCGVYLLACTPDKPAVHLPWRVVRGTRK